MKLTFLGAAHEVTGSCTLLEVNNKRILIDCGMEQGIDVYENYDLPVLPMDLDAVCLTHAHMDHSGKIPALVSKGFKGKIFATEATFRLCNIMLRDSAHIQEFEAQWRNRKAERSAGDVYIPLYTMADVEQTLKQFSYCGYGDTVTVCDGVTASFIDAGHLLGSASILLTLQEGQEKKTILFSGDIGNLNRPLIRDPQMPPKADYVVVESTYGDRTHGPRPDYVAQLTSILQETFDRGGNVVIPSFAIGRTQELLYLIRIIKEKGLVHGHDGFPVYVDSPLAVEATKIYASGLTDYYDEETLALLSQGIDPITFAGLRLSVTSDESKLINFDETPKVIISASGMCEAGRIRHHLKHNLWRKESAVLFVGYQSVGTLGRKLIDGAARVKLFGEEIAVNARIETMAGISGHADMEMVLMWLGAAGKPQIVFVNHGDDRSCDSFAETIQKRLRFSTVAPFSGDAYDLLSGECVQKGTVVRVAKKSKGRQNNLDAMERLRAAYARLGRLLDAMKVASNKEIAQLTDRILNLCEKFERK